MKEKLLEIIDSNKDDIIALGDKLFSCPELGFKEFKTKELLIEALKAFDQTIDEEFAITGFTTSIGKGKPHIAILAEMDALDCGGLIKHSCGHSSQAAIAIAAFKAFKALKQEFKGKLSLIFTPAEEYVDLNYRKELKKNGKINFLSGKQELIDSSIFDDIDIFLHMHAMSDDNYYFSSDTSLAGFIYKKFTFLGKSAHAAISPELGINALNACNLFLNAINMLKETFKEEDRVRFHGIIEEGGQSINAIPQKVIYTAYLRSINPLSLEMINAKINKAAKATSEALGADCLIEDELGYYPFKASKDLAQIFEKNMLYFCDAKKIKRGSFSIASGDIGDLSLFKPCIQFGYGGVCGIFHNANFEIIDKKRLYIDSAKLLALSIYDLFNDLEKTESIIANYKPLYTKDEYLKSHLGSK